MTKRHPDETLDQYRAFLMERHGAMRIAMQRAAQLVKQELTPAPAPDHRDPWYIERKQHESA